MHIGFRTSGGRGEYELVGSAGAYAASDLEGWSFHMEWPDGRLRDTNLWLDPGESGKPRLRSLAEPPIQIGRIISAMLILPEPRRDMRLVGEDSQVLQRHKYVMTRIGIATAVSYAPVAEAVQFSPTYVEVTNRFTTDLIGVTSRWKRIDSVYSSVANLETPVALLVERHRDIIMRGDPVDATLNQIVREIARELGRIDFTFVAEHDPLPALEQMARIIKPAEPDVPAPNELGEEEPDIRVRIAQKRRLSKSRDSSARSFSAKVVLAYHNRCAFCGRRLSGIEGVTSGIDAAHILAWSRYDLDVVRNGIALCKLHHWAFDAAIMMPVFESGSYKTRFTYLAERLDLQTRSSLGADGFIIPIEWLPRDAADRPSARYLKRLYEDLELGI